LFPPSVNPDTPEVIFCLWTRPREFFLNPTGAPPGIIMESGGPPLPVHPRMTLLGGEASGWPGGAQSTETRPLVCPPPSGDSNYGFSWARSGLGPPSCSRFSAHPSGPPPPRRLVGTLHSPRGPPPLRPLGVAPVPPGPCGVFFPVSPGSRTPNQHPEAAGGVKGAPGPLLVDDLVAGGAGATPAQGPTVPHPPFFYLYQNRPPPPFPGALGHLILGWLRPGLCKNGHPF